MGNYLYRASVNMNPNLASLTTVQVTSDAEHDYEDFMWLIHKSAAVHGLIFDTSVLTPGEIYTLSFKFLKTAGTLKNIGGHSSSFTQMEWFIDGVKQTSTYVNGGAVPDDDKVHVVTYTGLFHKQGSDSNKNLYIQPNRKLETTGSFLIWDVKLELGDTATLWSPAEEESAGWAGYQYQKVSAELPQLPEDGETQLDCWDRETYPYAYIYYSPNKNGDQETEYQLFVAKTPFYYRPYESGDSGRFDGYKLICTDNEAQGYVRRRDANGVYSSWAELFDYDYLQREVYEAVLPEYQYMNRWVVWSNHDILYEDSSTVYIAATTPINLESKLSISVDGYAELAYLESDGYQAIDTSFIPDANTRVVVDYQYSSTAVQNGIYDTALFGCGVSGDAQRGLCYNATNGTALQNPTTDEVMVAWLGRIPKDAGWTNYIKVSPPDTARHVIDFNDSAHGLRLDDELQGTFSNINFVSERTLYLFRSNQSNLVTGAQARIYSAAIYDGSTLIRDYIPVKRLSDNALGLYDKLHDVFYENVGSGTFTAGENAENETSVRVAFSCSNLNETAPVYKIAAWCYPEGTKYLDAPNTYMSVDSFPGKNHTEIWSITGLEANQVYELYACILANDTATDHNALIKFTIAGAEELDFSDVMLTVSWEQVIYNHYNFELSYAGLPYLANGWPAIFDVVGVTDAGDLAAMNGKISSGDGTVGGAFVNLEPLTEYTATFEIYYNGKPTGVTTTITFTTAEAFQKGYDRDSFLLGFASGLGCTAATKINVNQNSWMQGYIVGSALAAVIRGDGTGSGPGEDLVGGILSADGYALQDSNGVYLIPKEREAL